MNPDIKEGDVVQFQKGDSQISRTYQYGIVKETNVRKDGIVRKVLVKYRNNNEQTNCETFRAL